MAKRVPVGTFSNQYPTALAYPATPAAVAITPSPLAAAESGTMRQLFMPPPVAPGAPAPVSYPRGFDLATEARENYQAAWHQPPSRAVPPGGYYLPPEPVGFGRFFKPPQVLS